MTGPRLSRMPHVLPPCPTNRSRLFRNFTPLCASSPSGLTAVCSAARYPIGRTEMSTMRIMTAAALAAVFAVSTAWAQQPTQRVAGTLDKVEGNTLYIKSASGPVTLKLNDNALVVARVKASGAPNGTMTNGAVGQTVTSVDGPVLTVKYKDGEKKLVIGPTVPVQRLEVSDRNELKAGAAVAAAAATKQPDGTFTAARIDVGRGDAVP